MSMRGREEGGERRRHIRHPRSLLQTRRRPVPAPVHDPGEGSVTPLTRLDSYQSARAQWESLLPMSTSNTFFMTLQWQQAWWDQFGDGAEMILLGLTDHGDVKGIAPLVRRDRTISFIGGQDLFDYNDFLVSRGSEESFYPSLMAHLDAEEWGHRPAVLPARRLTHPGIPAGAGPEPAAIRWTSRRRTWPPAVLLPADWDSYLQLLTKKDRHELRRKLRRLQSSGEEFPLLQTCPIPPMWMMGWTISSPS